MYYISDSMEFNPDEISGKINIDYLIDILREFNEATKSLRAGNRSALYHRIKPKNKVMLIPGEEMLSALIRLRDMFVKDFGVNYRSRSQDIPGAIKMYENGELRSTVQYRFREFFNPITLEFVMEMLSKVYPFCLIVERPDGENELYKAIELVFLNGELPCYTPIFNLIFRLTMIPIDYWIYKKLIDETEGKYLYTRWGYKLQVWSGNSLDKKRVRNLIQEVSKILEEDMASQCTGDIFELLNDNHNL